LFVVQTYEGIGCFLAFALPDPVDRLFAHALGNGLVARRLYQRGPRSLAAMSSDQTERSFLDCGARLRVLTQKTDRHAHRAFRVGLKETLQSDEPDSFVRIV